VEVIWSGQDQEVQLVAEFCFEDAPLFLSANMMTPNQEGVFIPAHPSSWFYGFKGSKKLCNRKHVFRVYALEAYTNKVVAWAQSSPFLIWARRRRDGPRATGIQEMNKRARFVNDEEATRELLTSLAALARQSA
jgi:hypothetical protein